MASINQECIIEWEWESSGRELSGDKHLRPSIKWQRVKRIRRYSSFISKDYKLNTSRPTNMWPQNLNDAWLLALPTLVPYMILMSLKMMERQTPFTSETFLPEYDYIVGKLRISEIRENCRLIKLSNCQIIEEVKSDLFSDEFEFRCWLCCASFALKLL